MTAQTITLDDPATSRTKRIVTHVTLGALALVSVFPLYWMISTSLEPDHAVLDQSLLPGGFTLDNYAEVFRTIPMGRMLLNTFRMATLQTVVQLFTALLAAYAFARWTFRADRLLFKRR
jgi:ABC-type glycerol-3-phosphate transport system permease component